MIPLKIKQLKGKFKKISIPKYSELTVKQYKDFINSSAQKDMDIVKYICITNGFDYMKAQDFQIKGLDIINSSLGDFRILKADQPEIKEAKYIENLKPKFYMRVDHGKQNYEYFDLTKCKIETAGHRLLIEQEIKNKATWLDLYTFVTAMLMCGIKFQSNEKRYDHELIKKYQALLEKENAYDVLALGGFFLRNTINTGSFVKRVLINWIVRLLTRTFHLRNRPELTA
jgi:hypothetical protein